MTLPDLVTTFDVVLFLGCGITGVTGSRRSLSLLFFASFLENSLPEINGKMALAFMLICIQSILHNDLSFLLGIDRP